MAGDDEEEGAKKTRAPKAKAKAKAKAKSGPKEKGGKSESPPTVATAVEPALVKKPEVEPAGEPASEPAADAPSSAEPKPKSKPKVQHDLAAVFAEKDNSELNLERFGKLISKLSSTSTTSVFNAVVFIVQASRLWFLHDHISIRLCILM